MIAFNDSRCNTYYTSTALITKNSTNLNNPVFDPAKKIYSVTPISLSIDQDYIFDIIATSTGPFTDMNGAV